MDFKSLTDWGILWCGFG